LGEGALGMIERVVEYAKSLSVNDEILQWLETVATKALKEQRIDIYGLEHIVDWLNSSDAPSRLQRVSVEEAKKQAVKWSESNQKKGLALQDGPEDLEVFMKVGGFTIVKLLTKNAFLREGTFMSHCLGGYEPQQGVDIFSLRDDWNNPHATLEVRLNEKEVVQIKGKGNGSIHPKYIDSILEFLKKLNMDVRIEDMPNLGYYHIDDSLLQYAKSISSNDKFHVVGSDTFLFCLP
jgi:PcfJ-like protein